MRRSAGSPPPADHVDDKNFCVRLSVAQRQAVTVIASRELTSKAAVIRRLVAAGLRAQQAQARG